MSVLQSGALLWWDSRGHVPVTKGTMLGMEGPQGKDAGREGREAIFTATVYTVLSMFTHRDTTEKALSRSVVRQNSEKVPVPQRGWDPHSGPRASWAIFCLLRIDTNGL